MVAASVAILAGTAAVSFALLKILRLQIRSFLPALTIGNVGNLGLPLCLFAFGEHGLALAIALYVTNSVGQFTLVPTAASARGIPEDVARDPGDLRGARRDERCSSRASIYPRGWTRRSNCSAI